METQKDEKWGSEFIRAGEFDNLSTNRRGNRCLLSEFNDDLPEGKPKERFGEFNVYLYQNNRMGNRCSLSEFNDNW